MFRGGKVTYVLVIVFAALEDWACVAASPLFGPVFVYQRPIDAMVDITNDLGVAVLQDHVGTRSNFAFSPYGVASVLVLLYEGARGESARQIHDTMHFPWERDVTRIGFRDIHRHLRTYFSHEGYLSGITLSKNHTSLLPEYQRVLRFYGYDVSRPQGSTTRRPEDKTSGPVVTTPEGILLVITNETTSTAEDEVTTLMTTVEEVMNVSTTVDGGMETTTDDVSLQTTIEEGKETTSEKEVTTDLPDEMEGTTKSGEEVTTIKEETETPEAKVTDSTTVTSEGGDDESTSTEMVEGIKETEVTVTEISQEIKEITTTVDETTTKFETTTQDLKETTSKETEETVETTQDIKEVTEEEVETTNVPEEPSTVTEPVATDMPIDQIEIIPDVDMPVDSMSENQVSTLVDEPTTTNPTVETTTDSTTQETSESPSPSPSPSSSSSPSPSSSLLPSTSSPPSPLSSPSTSSSLSPSSSPSPSPSPEDTKKPSEEIVDVNVLPEKVTTEETDKETTATEPEDQTSTVEETSTTTDGTTEYTTEEVGSTTIDYTTVDELTTTEEEATTEKKDVTKDTISIFSMKTVVDTNKDNSSTRGPRTRRRRALRDESGLEYPDMSLQLQNGMYGSSVARNVDVLNERAPRAPFLVDGVAEESVPVMKYTAIFPYAFVPRLHAHALEFPLDDERYKLLLILPAERRGLRQLIHDLGSCPLREVFRALTPTRVHAVIPSFMVEGFVILTSTLQQMGIWDVFDPRRSNLSGMSGDPELFVRNIEQSITVVIRNYVEIVDIQTRTMAARSSPEVFLATHPFLYFVVDTETRVSLMAGKIVDPLNSRIY